MKIEHARFALTLDAERRIVQDASILVEGQRIARVGKAADLADVSADRVIDGRRFVVTPGFFNGHMHISYAHAVRGIFPDDLENRLFHVFNLQSAMTEEEEYLTTLLGILELLQNGTTCFLDPGTTRFPDACLQAYQDSGIRVVWSECVTDRPAPVKLPRFPAEEAIQRSAAFIEKWHGKLDGRMSAWAMAFSCETASAELLQGLKRLVDERGVCLTLHHQSGVAERKRYHEAYGASPTEYLEKLGVLGPNVMLAHVLGLSAAEVDAVARTGTNVVMCPTSAMKEAKGLHLNGNLPEVSGEGRQRGVRQRLGEQLQPPGRAPLDQPGGAPVQGRAPGSRRDPGRVGAGDGHAHGGQGVRARRRPRLDRAGQEGRPGPLRHPPAGVAGAVQPGQQPGLQRRRPERGHRDRGWHGR